MANQKISELTALTAPASGDQYVVVDVSDTSMAASGTNKSITDSKAIYSPATKVVALSGSSSRADYYTDGTADEAEIELAIAALPAGGGRILLMEGQYNISSAIDLNTANVLLEGQGESTILKLTNSTTANVITVGSSGSRTTIKNLKIDGNMSNQTVGGHGVFIDTAANQCMIEGCWIINTYKANIYDDGGDYTRIFNNYLDTTKIGAAWSNIEGGGIKPIVNGNFCFNSDYDGIGLYNSTYALIENNTISNQVVNGIEVGANSLVQGNNIVTTTQNGIVIVDDCTVIGNYISNPGRNGINGNGTRGINISSNFIDDFNASSSYFPISNSAGNSTVSGNTIKVNSSNNISCIQSSGATTLTIANNNIYTLGSGNHIGINMNAQYSSINNNSIEHGGSGTSLIGIKIDADYCSIKGNIVKKANIGISVSNINELLIDGNLCQNIATGISGSGFITKSCITNNLFEASSTSNEGIILGSTSSTCDRNLISGNIIINFDKEAIKLTRFQYNMISNNNIIDCGSGTDNTYSGILLQVGTATYSTYNSINGNQIRSTSSNKLQYGIRENSTSDGPSIITNNIVLGSVTGDISIQHSDSISANNITV